MSGAQHKIVGIGFGVAAAYALMHHYNEPMGIITAVGSSIGCMLPDIDHNKTKLGRKRKVATTFAGGMINVMVYGGIILGAFILVSTGLGFASYGVSTSHLALFIAGLVAFLVVRGVVTNSSIYKWSVAHRGIMHTLLPPLLLYVLMGLSDYPAWKFSILGVLVGYVSHLVADMLNADGCPLLFPLSRSALPGLGIPTRNKKACDVASWILAVGAVVASIMLF